MHGHSTASRESDVEADLTCGRTDLAGPRFADQRVPTEIKLTRDTLEKLSPTAYGRDDLDERGTNDLSRHTATAEATADTSLNGTYGWLAAIGRVGAPVVCWSPPSGCRLL